MNQAARIFQKALSSKNLKAILRVAEAFENMGDKERALRLYHYVTTLAYSVGFGAVGFGALERGTAVPGTGGMVIPPGRYWIDVFQDKRQVFEDWKKSKPEVQIETTEDHTSGTDFSWNPFTEAGNIAAWFSNPPQQAGTFIIFNVPKTANNYGLSGVWFPGSTLGIPTIAPSTVTSSQDTVQRPPPVTATDVLSQMAESAGKVAGAGAKGLGLTTSTMIKIGLAAALGLVLLPKVLAMTPAGTVVARL